MANWSPKKEATTLIRTLADGRTYEVLKNYYGMDELRSLLAPYADDLVFHRKVSSPTRQNGRFNLVDDADTAAAMVSSWPR